MSFSDSADAACQLAALAQDEIGWQNFVEGKIAKEWGSIQEQFYYSQHSKRMVDKWSAGLVMAMLELMHDMWIHQNSILHAVDDQGLPLAQSIALQLAIHVEFSTGIIVSS